MTVAELDAALETAWGKLVGIEQAILNLGVEGHTKAVLEHIQRAVEAIRAARWVLRDVPQPRPATAGENQAKGHVQMTLTDKVAR